ncbi:MAG: cytochrome c family protein [Alphaproteobacteria bacterium]|nr:cytochrome c family protein [Alphaproteobacteria bacterium]
MDELKFNKLAAGVLCGVLLIMAGIKTADVLLPHQHLDQNAYPIEVAETTSATAAPEAPKGADPVLALLASADIAAGEKLGKKCAACHSFNDGGPAKVGPNLWNIVNAPAARDGGFKYSTAMAEMGGEWSYGNLNQFLYKPKQWLKGTKMNYAGIKKANDRADVIAWLRSLSSAPVALPSDEEIAAEASNS